MYRRSADRLPWLVMIDHGRLKFDGPIGDLLHRTRAELVVAAERPGDLATVARLAAEAGTPPPPPTAACCASRHRRASPGR